jgi:hypothetical protein
MSLLDAAADPILNVSLSLSLLVPTPARSLTAVPMPDDDVLMQCTERVRGGRAEYKIDKCVCKRIFGEDVVALQNCYLVELAPFQIRLG